MDFVRSTSIETTSDQISADLDKTGDKSVQLVRGSFLPNNFLQNHYFKDTKIVTIMCQNDDLS